YRLDRRFFQFCRQMPVSSAATGVAVDLHWTLAPAHFRHGLDSEGLWRRLVAVPVAGRSIRTFGAEDLLLFLCVHGAKHLWSSIGWLVDIARLMDRPDLDWNRVVAQARARQISRI